MRLYSSSFILNTIPRAFFKHISIRLGCLEHVKTSLISTSLMYCNHRPTINVFSLQDVNEIRRDIEIPMISGQNLALIKNDDPRSLTSRAAKPIQGYSWYCSRELALLAPLHWAPFRPAIYGTVYIFHM